MGDTLNAYTARAQKIARKLERIRTSGDREKQQRAVETIRKARTGIVQDEDVKATLQLVLHHTEMMEELYTFYVEKAQRCINNEILLTYTWQAGSPDPDWINSMKKKCDECKAALNALRPVFDGIKKDADTTKACKPSDKVLRQYSEAMKGPYNKFLTKINALRTDMLKVCDLEESDLKLPSVKFGTKFTPTCNGTELPKKIRDWYDKKADNYAEKILFCKLPGAFETVLEKAADTILDGPQKAFMKTLQAHAFSNDTSMGINEGDRVGKFTVVMADKGFLALGRKKSKADEKPTGVGLPFWQALAGLAQSALSCAAALVRGCASATSWTVSTVLANLNYNFIKYSIAVAAFGGAAYGLGSLMYAWPTLEAAATTTATEAATAATNAAAAATPEFASALELETAARAAAAAASAPIAAQVAENAAKFANDTLKMTLSTASTDFAPEDAAKTVTETAAEAVENVCYVPLAEAFAKSPVKNVAEAAEIVRKAANQVKKDIERIISEENVVPSPNRTDTMIRKRISEAHFGGLGLNFVPPNRNPINNLARANIFGNASEELARKIQAEANTPAVGQAVEQRIASTAVATRYAIEDAIDRLNPFFGRVLTSDNRNRLKVEFPQSVTKAEAALNIDVLLGKTTDPVLKAAAEAIATSTLLQPPQPPPQQLDGVVQTFIGNAPRPELERAAERIAHDVPARAPSKASVLNFPSFLGGGKPSAPKKAATADEEAIMDNRRRRKQLEKQIQDSVEKVFEENKGSNKALTALRDDILTKAAGEIANKARDRGILQKEIETLAKGEGGGVVDYANAGAIADTTGDMWKGALVGLGLVSVITGNLPGLYLLGGAGIAASAAASEAASAAASAEVMYAIAGGASGVGA
jgi:hypothetical protein